MRILEVPSFEINSSDSTRKFRVKNDPSVIPLYDTIIPLYDAIIPLHNPIIPLHFTVWSSESLGKNSTGLWDPRDGTEDNRVRLSLLSLRRRPPNVWGEGHVTDVDRETVQLRFCLSADRHKPAEIVPSANRLEIRSIAFGHTMRTLICEWHVRGNIVADKSGMLASCLQENIHALP